MVLMKWVISFITEIIDNMMLNWDLPMVSITFGHHRCKDYPIFKHWLFENECHYFYSNFDEGLSDWLLSEGMGTLGLPVATFSILSIERF
jgi:hypothetical protein